MPRHAVQMKWNVLSAQARSWAHGIALINCPAFDTIQRRQLTLEEIVDIVLDPQEVNTSSQTIELQHVPTCILICILRTKATRHPSETLCKEDEHLIEEHDRRTREKWEEFISSSLKCNYRAIALCHFCISTENKRVRTTINSFVRESKNYQHLNDCSYSSAAFCALAFFYMTL